MRSILATSTYLAFAVIILANLMDGGLLRLP